MKTIIIALAISAAYCAKLEKTYLPPGASTAGGSGDFLSAPSYDQTPGSGVIASKSTGSQTFSSHSGVTAARFGSSHSSSYSSSQPSSFGSSSSYASHGSSYNSQPSSFGLSQSSYGNGQASQRNYEQIPILKYSNENHEGQYRYAFETANGIMAQEEGYQKDTENQEVQGSYSYTSPEGEKITVQYIANENGFQPVGSHIPTPPPIPDAILKSIKFNQEQEARGISDDGSYRSYEDSHMGYGSSAPSNQYLTPQSRFSSQKPSNQYLAPRQNTPSNQYLAPRTQVLTAPKPNNQYLAPRNSKPSNQYLSPDVSAKQVSNQYLAPRKTGFSEKTGYHY